MTAATPSSPEHPAGIHPGPPTSSSAPPEAAGRPLSLGGAGGLPGGDAADPLQHVLGTQRGHGLCQRALLHQAVHGGGRRDHLLLQPPGSARPPQGRPHDGQHLLAGGQGVALGVGAQAGPGAGQGLQLQGWRRRLLQRPAELRGRGQPSAPPSRGLWGGHGAAGNCPVPTPDPGGGRAPAHRAAERLALAVDGELPAGLVALVERDGHGYQPGVAPCLAESVQVLQQARPAQEGLERGQRLASPRHPHCATPCLSFPPLSFTSRSM